ncbi:MAG: multidrug ABC transporter ATP-binding protein [Lentisphaerae bacterium RIFOXYA12_FULL_48_11]|nr:MAG: multidrug ABC transporter ATP-binding protein [Lentisphaerae bacterium RIFOXYA12_FULL_48_11]
MNIIEVNNLTKSFDKLTAVDNLCLSVAEGEIFGLVGPDGAGKTTTMRLLTSIMDPTSGNVAVAGFNTVSDAERVKEHIGYMSQRFGLYADLTVAENIDFYADIYQVPKDGRTERTEKLLSFSNLAPFKNRLAGKLSGGMKQKLGLACALIHKPSVLFLDEPTNGVDPVSRREFWRLLYQLLKEKVTIFVSTAYLDEAERCNRVALIHKGNLLAIGTPDEIKKLMHGAVMEIRVSEPRHVTELLQANLNNASISLFGDRIHLVAEKIEETYKQAAKIISSNGIDLLSCRTIEPALEDVFISILTSEKDKT